MREMSGVVRRCCRSNDRLCFGVLLACVLIAGPIQAASAQDSRSTTVSMFAGGSQYDLSGVGWTAVFGPRVDHTFLAPLGVQFSLPVYRYEPQLADKITYVLPEVSVLVSPQLGRVSPYVGFGLGWSFVVSGPDGLNELTLHVAVGVRVQLAGPWDLRSEGRLRAMDPWSGNTADISGGVGYRF